MNLRIKIRNRDIIKDFYKISEEKNNFKYFNQILEF